MDMKPKSYHGFKRRLPPVKMTCFDTDGRISSLVVKTNRLDLWNPALYCSWPIGEQLVLSLITGSSTAGLQLLQNVADRLSTGAKKFELRTS